MRWHIRGPIAQRARAARDAAREAGEPTYIGQPCIYGHDGLRSTRTKDCIHCDRARAQVTKIVEAKKLDEFVARNLDAFAELERRAEARCG